MKIMDFLLYKELFLQNEMFFDINEGVRDVVKRGILSDICIIDLVKLRYE